MWAFACLSGYVTEAVEHHELRSCGPHEYVRLFLRERQRELHSLERRYGRKAVLANDYADRADLLAPGGRASFSQKSGRGLLPGTTAGTEELGAERAADAWVGPSSRPEY